MSCWQFSASIQGREAAVATRDKEVLVIVSRCRRAMRHKDEA